MTQLVDPARVVLPGSLAAALAGACTAQMDGHQWSTANMAAARTVLAGDGAAALLDALARHLDRNDGDAPGWAVVALPARLGDEELMVAAAGVLAALGTPFFSINQAGRLWIGQETTAEKDASSFGGIGAQALHIDAPNVERVPEYTSLLVLRPDPAGGGTSLLGDLHAAVALLDEGDRRALGEPVFFEGAAEGLCGVGAPRQPFPVLDTDERGDLLWVRWAGKMVSDPRNRGRRGLLERFAAALATSAAAVTLERGQLLIIDQRRTAHGRTALGRQQGLADGTRRWILQAKAAYDADAPAHRVRTSAGRRDHA